jgi:UDP-glucose 4-epimerase
MAIFSEQLLAGIRPVIYGDGRKVRDYVYVEDVARANLAALDTGTGEIFNIASGVPTTDYEVFRLIRDALGGGAVEPEYVDKRPGEIDRIYLDISKAERLLGWTPHVVLEEGARRTARFFREAVAPARTAIADSAQKAKA